MDPTSPLPAIVSLLVAMGTTFILAKVFGKPSEQDRFTSIDGLRGFLAFFVFLHHSCIWYFYLRTGQWNLPPSNLYAHFGGSSVAFFFMITGFLFFSKLIDGRVKGIDWLRLYVSRFLRLTPLYIFLVFLVFLVVAYLSDAKLNEPIPLLIKHAAYWLGFTILGTPNLNGIERTATVVAGVTWSLRYEWFFYFSLPLLAVAVRLRPPFPYILLGIASVVGMAVWHPQIHYLMTFLVGIAAAIVVRLSTFRAFATGTGASFIPLVCIVAAVIFFPSMHEVVPFFLLSLAFIFIACGNSLFGILTNPTSRALGEAAYSIYLLHGIILFGTFTFILGLAESRNLSPIMHWLLIVGITPPLIFVCFVTFRYIERPAMQSTKRCTAWVRSHIPRPFGTLTSRNG